MLKRGYGIRLLILITFSMHMVGLSAADAGYTVTRDISYGDPAVAAVEEQTLDLYWTDNTEKRAVIVYVHGGGWAFGDKKDVYRKPDFFISHNIAFISMNYRLRWDHTILDQGSDVVSVVKWVRTNANKYGLDPNRIILMGYAAGAHLVSLVATDERYLRAGGLSFRSLAGIVSIDNMNYDIPRHFKETANYIEQRHLAVIFGEDDKVWRAASPATYVKKDKNIPAFALLYVTSEEASTKQANAFAKLLTLAGVDTILVPSSEQTSESIDETLGTPGDRTTLALITFIRAKI